VFNNQVLLSALSLDLFAVFFGGAVALLPIFASEVLRSVPKGSACCGPPRRWVRR
jgi:hypothetical protein